MRDPLVDLWALDEVHFQQHGSRCRMWVPPEIKDPILYHHPTRHSVGYFGAVRLRDGKFFYVRQAWRFNGQSFWEFLQLLREASAVEGRTNTTMPGCTCPGGSNLLRTSHSTSFRPIVPNSIPSRGSGN